MATAADCSSNHNPPLSLQSPRGPELTGDSSTIVSDSPKLRRSNLTSPWAQVVRGESDAITAVNKSPASSSSSLSSLATSMPDLPPFENCSTVAASSSLPTINYVTDENSNTNNVIAACPKKLAWNRPSNGVIEVGSVMDADSWPALSESNRASPRPASDSSTKPATDGSISNSQGLVPTNSPKKQAFTNTNPNVTPGHSLPARQRHSKHSGDIGSGTSHSTFPHHSLSPSPSPPPPPPPLSPPPPPPPLYPIYQMPPPNAYGNFMPQIREPPPRGSSFRSNHWETRPMGGIISQPRAAHDHRNSSRRGNLGPHHHGDGAYPNSHGARREQDRGSHGNARDAHMQPHRAPPRGFVRPPPPNATAFMPPPSMRPFPHPIGCQEFIYVPTLPYEPIRGVMPFIRHPPTPGMPFPVAEPSLPTLIVNQIDYYFSDANLIKDEFLRSNMDDLGWVPVSLIANFRRVKNLTDNVQVILSSLRASIIVEIQDDKVRRRSEWRKWLPTSSRQSIESSSFSLGSSSSDTLSASFEKITVEEPASGHNSVARKTDPKPEIGSENCFIEPITQPELPNGEITQNALSS